ncbi:DUF2786 domain-containing protein [Nocardiopsis sp. RSe5-2]|uniref:DUF2786 domain-containing protein n=1 Tax=Nocardiopsis endophytica TaxID=3018445 RepID=A0ABT4TZH6_9ACTN|nr:DUF2786 domain-containing protein [Nocardiopsis endophytica]MDA2809502.1 DUF2786 domain-containing protein [Nocardiopsis endophytica]
MSEAEKASELIGSAVGAVRDDDEAGVDAALAPLADSSRPEWARTVDRALLSVLTSHVAHAWRRNWQPAELVRHAGRELGADAERTCADAVLAEHRERPGAALDPRWREQLHSLEADAAEGAGAVRPGAAHLTRFEAVELALRLAVLLEAVPPLQRLCARPGEAEAPVAGPTGSPKLDRVRALLAKAESTEFPDEAEALTARAQAMMARHSIDEALLRAGGGPSPETVGVRLPVDAPYDEHKATLLNVVAEANHCRAVWHQELGLCTVVGRPADVEGVELLAASLLAQAASAMVATGARREKAGRSNRKAFRASFWAAFADRIGERLERSAQEAEREAAAEHAAEGRDLVPLFAERKREVDAAVDRMFQELTYSRVRGPADIDGWHAGRAAADDAALRARERLRGA